MWGCSSTWTIESNYVCSGGTTSILKSGTPKFLPVTENFLYTRVNLTVTERKLHLFKIKIGVGASLYGLRPIIEFMKLNFSMQAILLLKIKVFILDNNSNTKKIYYLKINNFFYHWINFIF